MKKKLLAVLLATGVAATTLLGGSILVSAADDGGNTAQARTLDEIKEDGKIKIGVFSDKNPFGYVDENGDVQGYDVYFGKRLAKDLLGSEDDVEFTYVEAASRVEYLQSAKVDVILANFTVTDDRAEKVDFALPYMKVALGVVSPDNAVITDVKDLEGKKLIVVKGTTAETYFTDNYPDIELVKYDEYQEAYDALLDGRGDAFSTDNTEVLAWAQQNEGFSVGIESLGNIDTIAPAVQKGNTDLLNAINDEIKSLADEQFFHKDYEETLKPVYGDDINPEDLVVEGGVVDSEDTATEDADRLQDEQMDLESANEQDEERIKVIDEKLEYLRKCAEKHAMEVSKVHMRLSQESQKLEFQEDNQERIRSEIERLSEEFNENQKDVGDVNENVKTLQQQIEELKDALNLMEQKIITDQKRHQKIQEEVKTKEILYKDILKEREEMIERVSGYDKEIYRLESQKDGKKQKKKELLATLSHLSGIHILTGCFFML